MRGAGGETRRPPRVHEGEITVTEQRGRVIERFSLCTADCDPKEGYHVPTWLSCQRCGAKIHNRVYRVETVAGEEMIVGAECMKAVVGFRWGKSHDRAEALRPLIRQLAAEGFTHIVYDPWVVSPTVWAVKTRQCAWGWPEHWVREGKAVELPFRMSTHLLRAGADLGLWTRESDRGLFCGHRADWHEIVAVPAAREGSA